MSVLQTETHTERIGLGPTTRSVELFYLDLQYYGEVRPETAQAVIDEEKTNAAEDIARVKSGYAAVPRTYFQKNGDLFDVHGNSLSEVLSGGVTWAEEDTANNVAGADWELKRRKAEQNNLTNFIAAGPGTVFVEISVPPDKPEHELKQQGYSDMTHIRISAKDSTERVLQHNLYIPDKSTKLSMNLQRLIGAQKMYDDAQELLENPLVLAAGKDMKSTIREIENLCGAVFFNSSADQSVLQMIKKAVGAKKEAWEFVSSAEHTDLNSELEQRIEALAKKDPWLWDDGMERIRIGYLKELRERYDGKRHRAENGSIIDAAAAQAVAQSDVFITCGGTIEARNSSSSIVSNASEVAAKLIGEVAGSGACQACGAKGTLYGCGVMCSACNRIWCAEYAKSNGKKELSYSEVRYLRYGKMGGDFQKSYFVDEIIDTLRQWNRKYELERKEKTRGAGEAQIIKNT